MIRHVMIIVPIGVCLTFLGKAPQLMAANLNQNLMTCTRAPSIGDVDECFVDQTQIFPAQELDSKFKAEYTFNCAPGPSHWLSIGIQDPIGGTTYFNFGESGTIEIMGKGPLTIRDDRKNKTHNMNFHQGCSLVVSKITATPTPGAIAEALAALKVNADLSSRLFTKEKELNTVYVLGAHALLCDIGTLYTKLSEMYFGPDAKPSPDEIVKDDNGGESAKSLLTQAIETAANAGAIDLGGLAEFDYLKVNLASILSNEPSCKQTGAGTLTPDLGRCGTKAECIANYNDFVRDEQQLNAIVIRAKALRALAPAQVADNWIDNYAKIINQ